MESGLDKLILLLRHVENHLVGLQQGSVGHIQTRNLLGACVTEALLAGLTLAFLAGSIWEPAAGLIHVDGWLHDPAPVLLTRRVGLPCHLLVLSLGGSQLRLLPRLGRNPYLLRSGWHCDVLRRVTRVRHELKRLLDERLLGHSHAWLPLRLCLFFLRLLLKLRISRAPFQDVANWFLSQHILLLLRFSWLRSLSGTWLLVEKVSFFFKDLFQILHFLVGGIFWHSNFYVLVHKHVF